MLTPMDEFGMLYEKRSRANQRFHCICGRFVRGHTVKVEGTYFGRLTWTCTHCGPCSE
jgi:hypothetical protein